jgi:hypothetical protein
MSCCCKTSDKDAVTRVNELLATGGLREIVEQTQNANRVMTDSIRHLEKADRAAALGYAQDVVALHRSAGERANRMCRRQFRAVIEAVDERVSRNDWPDLVAKVRSEYDTHEGPEQLEDAKAEFRARLLDMDTLPSRDTGQVVDMLDQAFERVATDGLAGGMRLLRDHLDNALDILSAPEMGRQPGSPGTAAFFACLAGAFAIYCVALAICFGAPFCWCCLAPFILIAYSVAAGSCAALAFVDAP